MGFRSVYETVESKKMEFWDSHLSGGIGSVLTWRFFSAEQFLQFHPSWGSNHHNFTIRTLSNSIECCNLEVVLCLLPCKVNFQRRKSWKTTEAQLRHQVFHFRFTPCLEHSTFNAWNQLPVEQSWKKGWIGRNINLLQKFIWTLFPLRYINLLHGTCLVPMFLGILEVLMQWIANPVPGQNLSKNQPLGTSSVLHVYFPSNHLSESILHFILGYS